MMMMIMMVVVVRVMVMAGRDCGGGGDGGCVVAITVKMAHDTTDDSAPWMLLKKGSYITHASLALHA